VDLPAEPAALEALRVADVRQELRQAAHVLQECGLAHSAVWAAEQLRGLRQEEEDDAGMATVSTRDAAVPDALLLAKAYFDAKVRERLAHGVVEDVDAAA
jgi:Anaphase promoting complex subunit 8 / Cdc23